MYSFPWWSRSWPRMKGCCCRPVQCDFHISWSNPGHHRKLLANVFTRVISGCPSCRSDRSLCLYFGGIMTLDPQRIHPLSVDNSIKIWIRHKLWPSWQCQIKDLWKIWIMSCLCGNVICWNRQLINTQKCDTQKTPPSLVLSSVSRLHGRHDNASALAWSLDLLYWLS